MKKNLLLFTTALLFCAIAAHCEELFPTLTSEAIPYRIPALAVLEGNKMLALTDYRHCKKDIGYGMYNRNLIPYVFSN
jgi:hypothetical protein